MRIYISDGTEANGIAFDIDYLNKWHTGEVLKALKELYEMYYSRSVEDKDLF